MANKVTITEIARQCGISPTTVSLVLRNRPGIGDETRQRVRDVAQELGYQRHTTAQIESLREHLNVGCIVRSGRRGRVERTPRADPFYSWVFAGIEATARSQQMNLLYASVPVDERNVPLDFPRHLLAQRLDAVLIVGAFSDETVREIRSQLHIPTVLVDATPGPQLHDAVIVDQKGGAHALASYLIAHGHQQIGIISLPREADPNLAQRRDGFIMAMEESGLTPVIGEVVHHDDVGSTTTALLKRNPGLTALIGADDSIAIDAMRAAQSLGRTIPSDISIVGFDDLELAGKVTPALTTMAIDKVTMGSLAVQILSHRLARRDAAGILTMLRTELIERSTVVFASPTQASS